MKQPVDFDGAAFHPVGNVRFGVLEGVHGDEDFGKEDFQAVAIAEVKIDGAELLIMKESDIMGILDK